MNLKELKAIASDATPGPWWIRGNEVIGDVGSCEDDDCGEVRVCETWDHQEVDRVHIAQFNPQTVLSLLSDLEKCVEGLEKIIGMPDEYKEQHRREAAKTLSSLTIRSDEG
jgi:hypothetical protein